MSLFKRRDDEPSTDLAVVEPVVVEPEPIPEPPPDTDFIWRCTNCGAMGTKREGVHAHIGRVRRGGICEAECIRHYVLAVEQEYEAKAAEVSASGIWIIVKLPDDTPEGEIKLKHRNGHEIDEWDVWITEGASGLAAIQERYKCQAKRLGPNSTEEHRNEMNGRYVAIDFFTGHRAEALIESEWRANVEVAEGSHT